MIETEQEIIEAAEKLQKKGRSGKETNILQQIQYNADLPSEDIIEPNGTIYHKKKLIAVDSYSTKFLTSRDQLLLATDKIAFPEVKAGLKPARFYRRGEKAFDEWEGLAFEAEFSLNNGDKDALQKLVANFPGGMKEHYIFEVYPETIYHGTFDETSAFRNLGKQKKSANAEQAETQMLDICRQVYMDISLIAASKERIAIAFDMYDDGTGISGSADIPSVSAVFSINIVSAARKRFIWGYSVYIMTQNARVPDDATIKLYFEPSKILLRAGLADMGLSPYFSLIE